MKRRLIKQAGQAITITLPIDWIRKNGLTAGNEIELEENEKDLILKSGKKTVTGSITIDTEGFTERMRYIYLNAAYAKGVDEIKLIDSKYPNLDQNMGMAVISQKNKECVIKDISGVASENLDEIFKRIFQIIIGFYDSAIEDIFGKQTSTEELIHKVDGEINKFSLFLERSIMKLSYPDADSGKIMFAYAFSLEKIGDEIVRLWVTNTQSKIKKDNRLKEIITLSRNCLQKAFEVYYQSDAKKIKEQITIRDEVREKAAKLLKARPETAKLIMHAIKILEDSRDLTHLSLMKKLKVE